jgi:diadenylate cyclase
VTKRLGERTSLMDEQLVSALQMIAPGTLLREAIENIVRARTGALLVFADEDEIKPIISGGIDIDAALRPMILYELAKMDGAILLDRAGTHIIHANVQLMPDASIESQETGTRHRTAERVAKQLGAVAISISAARDVVTIYIDQIRYIMDPIRVILSKADQALQTLERFKYRLNQVMATLSVLEFQERVTLFDVTTVLQRTEMVLTLSHLIERYMIELGAEGRLVELQTEELLRNVREDRIAVLADYLPDPTPQRLEAAREALIAMPSDELISLDSVGMILGYAPSENVLETHVHPRGLRMLQKIPRLSQEAANSVLKRFDELQAILKAPVDELAALEGVGPSRARDIKEGLLRLRDFDLTERDR